MNETAKQTYRQKIARGLATVFFMPVAIGVQLFTTPPGPDWIYRYSKVFEKIAGPGGFTWRNK